MESATKHTSRDIVLAGVMVALAIIAWVVPFLPDRPERAGQSQSMTNAKQLAVAMMQYAQDYDGRLPGWVKRPDGRFAHNAWDQQISLYVKSPDVYGGNVGGGIRSYSDPQRRRVVSYGLNGLLMTPPKKVFDGHADFSHPPTKPLAVGQAHHPEETILFAQLATDKPMRGRYGESPNPAPDVFGPAASQPARAWQKALDGWIDISPRDFVENTPPPGCYHQETWDPTNGVARDLYAGGGAYAFLDGHVKFMRIADSLRSPAARNHEDSRQYWAADNLYNMWNPYR